MAEAAVSALRHELAALTPDAWPIVRRRAVAQLVALDLLAAVDGPPSPQSRRSADNRFRVHLALGRTAA
jgi:hypothetical protein